jgi:hypothetical protein
MGDAPYCWNIISERIVVLCVLCRVQTGAGFHPAPFSVDIGGHFFPMSSGES